MNLEKYLPLGTVVLLKGGKKRVMVVGFMATSHDVGEKVFDYMGCLYPEGIISSDKTLVFDHDQIERVFALGFSDDEEKNFKSKINNMNVNKNGQPVNTSLNQINNNLLFNNNNNTNA